MILFIYLFIYRLDQEDITPPTGFLLLLIQLNIMVFRVLSYISDAYTLHLNSVRAFERLTQQNMTLLLFCRDCTTQTKTMTKRELNAVIDYLKILTIAPSINTTLTDKSLHFPSRLCDSMKWCGCKQIVTLILYCLSCDHNVHFSTQVLYFQYWRRSIALLNYRNSYKIK